MIIKKNRRPRSSRSNRDSTHSRNSTPAFGEKLDQLKTDLTQHVDLRFEEFRHDLLGAFRDALSMLSDKFDREHELVMDHEKRLRDVEARR